MQTQIIWVKTEKGYKTISPFDYVEYFDAGGRIEIKIGDAARPYFFDLKDKFTALQLRSLLTCSSKHAKRIYAMCCQWRKKGKFTISISTLKERLFLKDPKNKFPEQFEKINSFKLYVLDIAKEQINKNSDIEIDYKFIKTGRAFTDIEFTIKSKGAIQPEIDFKMPIDAQKYIKEISAYGIREPHLTNIATAMAESDRVRCTVAEVITETKVKFSKQQVDSIPAYIVDALKRKKIIK